MVSACKSHSLAFDFVSLYLVGRKYSEMTAKVQKSVDVQTASEVCINCRPYKISYNDTESKG